MKWLIRCICIVCAGVIFSSCLFKTTSNLTVTASKSSFPLIALSKQSKKAVIENEVSPYLYFAFSKELNEKIVTLSQFHSHASLTLSLQLDSALDTAIALGFLYSSDFTSSFSLKKESLPPRALVKGKVSSNSLGSKILSVSFAFPLQSDNPVKGFFVYGTEAMSVVSALLEKPLLGWSFEKEQRVFAFSPLGGIIPSSLSQAQVLGLDFSEGSQLGLSPAEVYVTASFRNNSDDTGLLTNRNSVVFDMGSELFTVLRSPIQKNVHFYTSQLTLQSRTVHITRNKEMVTGLLYTSDETLYEKKSSAVLYQLKPIKADPGLIVVWDSSTWRTEDFELFSWELFPTVLIFDFKDYRVQDQFLRRLAFFVEKKGYTGRLITDEELGNQHGFNAHDYRPESLAAFFSLADEQNFPLNEKELLLRHILLEQGVLKIEGSKIVSGEGALLSISQESNLSLRYTLIGHEGYHGIYFTHEDFRKFNAQVFNNADPSTLAFLLGYFTITPTLNYDNTDEYLIKNEFMAYLLQQSVQQTPQYFINIANRSSVIKGLPELSHYIKQTKGQGFADSASQLEDFIFSHYGLTAGRLALVSRSKP